MLVKHPYLLFWAHALVCLLDCRCAGRLSEPSFGDQKLTHASLLLLFSLYYPAKKSKTRKSSFLE